MLQARMRAFCFATLVALAGCGGGGGSTPGGPVVTPSPVPTATPSTVPTASPTPTASPAATPTASPVATPTASPAATPTASPAATPTASPAATPTASPVPTPTAAPVVVNISPLQLVGVGSQYAKTITVTQAGYNGQFTLGGTSCNGITVSNTTTSLSDFTITPVAVGLCSYTITGGGGAQTTLQVSVTTLTVGGQ